MRSLFSVLVTTIVSKAIQSLESASINGQLPPELWGQLWEVFGVMQQSPPIYPQAFLQCTPDDPAYRPPWTIRAFRMKVPDLERWKLIFLPACLNIVDAVFKTLLLCTRTCWTPKL